VATENQISAALRLQWHLPPDECVPMPESETPRWRIAVGGQRYVAELVPGTSSEQLLAGLTVAEHLDRLGFSVGAPVRALDGVCAVPTPGGLLVLRRFVPGRPLDPEDPVDQLWWGDLLGAVHHGLSGFRDSRLVRLRPLNPDAPHLDLEPWLRPAVATATAALVRMTVTDQLTYGVVHGDPSPRSFRIDPATGRAGLVGWHSVAIGLLMFDVANAVAYAGGTERATELLDGYRAAGPLTPEEIESALPVVLRCRWARRADRFAQRITGGSVDDADWAGLHEARDALAALANT
jgi:Ser/Thr protein kinase RdoA (MazF antagonist)